MCLCMYVFFHVKPFFVYTPVEHLLIVVSVPTVLILERYTALWPQNLRHRGSIYILHCNAGRRVDKANTLPIVPGTTDTTDIEKERKT